MLGAVGVNVWELLIVLLLDGREAHVNPREIVSLTDARGADDPGKHYTDEVKCVMSMTDGKLLTTAERCDAIDRRLHEIDAKRIEGLRQ